MLGTIGYCFSAHNSCAAAHNCRCLRGLLWLLLDCSLSLIPDCSRSYRSFITGLVSARLAFVSPKIAIFYATCGILPAHHIVRPLFALSSDRYPTHKKARPCSALLHPPIPPLLFPSLLLFPDFLFRFRCPKINKTESCSAFPFSHHLLLSPWSIPPPPPPPPTPQSLPSHLRLRPATRQNALPRLKLADDPPKAWSRQKKKIFPTPPPTTPT